MLPHRRLGNLVLTGAASGACAGAPVDRRPERLPGPVRCRRGRRRDHPRLQLRPGPHPRPRWPRATATPRSRSPTGSAPPAGRSSASLPLPPPGRPGGLARAQPGPGAAGAQSSTTWLRKRLAGGGPGGVVEGAVGRLGRRPRPRPWPGRGGCCRGRTGPGGRSVSRAGWAAAQASRAWNEVPLEADPVDRVDVGQAADRHRRTGPGSGRPRSRRAAPTRPASRSLPAPPQLAVAPSTAARRRARSGPAGRRRRGSWSAPTAGSPGCRGRGGSGRRRGCSGRRRAPGRPAPWPGSASSPAAASTAGGGAGAVIRARAGRGTVDQTRRRLAAVSPPARVTVAPSGPSSTRSAAVR